MNKFAIATATPALLIAADALAHLSDEGYNHALAVTLICMFSLMAIGLVIKNAGDLRKNEKGN